LKAGIWEEGQLLFPEAGTPQGGVLSPVLANIALHGFETHVSRTTRQHRVTVIRYADDFVVLCDDLDTLQAAIGDADEWLAAMGLRIKAAKTRITHTRDAHEGQAGFDFLGFHVQQYRMGQRHRHRRKADYKTLIQPSRKAMQRHLDRIKEIVWAQRGVPQAALIAALNPVIRGWAMNYRASVAKRVFSQLDHLVYDQLRHWAHFRHPHQSGGWRYQRYWKRPRDRIEFTDGTSTLERHEDIRIVRHVKVQGDKSPYDGDWVYWGARLGRDPTQSPRVLRLLKEQQGRCGRCGLRLTTEDVLEVHHPDGNHSNNRLSNLVLLHVHCHDQEHGTRCP
jgi:RNA-directed DNA polymerase